MVNGLNSSVPSLASNGNQVAFKGLLRMLFPDNGVTKETIKKSAELSKLGADACRKANDGVQNGILDNIVEGGVKKANTLLKGATKEIGSA